MFMMLMDMMMFFRLFSFFFIEQPFEWLFMLDLFHGIFIDYVYDLGLVCILLSVFKDRYQRQDKPQKQEKLDEIIRSTDFYGLRACSYYADSITDSEESSCYDPQESEVE